MPISAQEDQQIRLIKAKCEQEYLHSLKNKLATLKAVKAPFSKLSGNKTLFITTVLSLSAIAYFIWKNDEYAFVHNLLLKKQIFEKNHEKAVFLTFAMNREKVNIMLSRACALLSAFCGSIPWSSAIVNKWLGWSCESLEQDIKSVRRGDV